MKKNYTIRYTDMLFGTVEKVRDNKGIMKFETIKEAEDFMINHFFVEDVKNIKIMDGREVIKTITK